MGQGLAFWAQSGELTRFSGPSCKDMRNPIRPYRTSFRTRANRPRTRANRPSRASLLKSPRIESVVSRVLPEKPYGMHQGQPVRVWGLGQRNMALATCEEVPARQIGHAEQVYFRSQGLDPSSWGSDWRRFGLGPGGAAILANFLAPKY